MPRKSRKKRKSRKHRGGAGMVIPKPSISNTSASGAIQGMMNKQKAGNQEVADLNKQFSGGGPVEDIVVPQMGQAGAAGNATITGGIASTLQGGADGEFDNDVHKTALSDGMGGGRRRRRKTKRKSRKSRRKRRRRKTRKTRKKIKSRRKRRR
tara:strand:+ start:58 stop:516 length:459 start_codon:yes stop_codon:yes gene_type:complete